MSSFTFNYVRLGLVVFIVALALGLELGKIYAAQAALVLSALVVAVFAVCRIKEIKVFPRIIFLIAFAAILGLGRGAVVNTSSILPREFEAVVFSDTVPTSYGSMTAVSLSESGKLLKVYSTRYPEFNTGDKVNIQIKSSNFKSPSYASGTIILIEADRGNKIFSLLAGVKRGFLNKLSEVLPEPHAAFVAGTVIGGAAGIPQHIKDKFTVSGLSHILAASGYNFTLLLVFFTFLLRSFSLKKQTIVFLLIIPAFAIIAGASPSVIRAGAMGALVSVGLFLGRISTAKTALLWAAAIMLFLNPTLLKYDLGFQLSFLATAGLVLIIPIFERISKINPELDHRSLKSKIKLTMIEIFFASLAAQIVTLPLLVFTFGSISTVALFANLLVVPIIPLIMVSGIVASAVALVSTTLGQIVGFLAYIIASYVFTVVDVFANFSWSQITVSVSANFIWLSYMGLIFAIALFHIKFLKHKYG